MCRGFMIAALVAILAGCTSREQRAQSLLDQGKYEEVIQVYSDLPIASFAAEKLRQKAINDSLSLLPTLPIQANQDSLEQIARDRREDAARDSLRRAQAQAEPSFGDEYSIVAKKLSLDPLRSGHRIVTSENKIIDVNPLFDKSINDYCFENGRLIAKRVLAAANPDGAMAWNYQNAMETGFTPKEITMNGARAYTWVNESARLVIYIYREFSPWFQKECMVREVRQSESH